MRGHIHHIEWCVSKLDELSDQLVHGFGFRVVSERESTLNDTHHVRQRVLKSGYTQFMLTEKKLLQQQQQQHSNGCATNGEVNGSTSNGVSTNNDSGSRSKKARLVDENIYPVLTCCDGDHEIDSVFNVCLEVSDVDRVTNNILEANSQYPRAQASVVIPPKSIKVKIESDDSEVSIRYSVIRTPCGNVIHTLMNSEEYKRKTGLPFLPGFNDVINEAPVTSDDCLLTTHMDHVTYVCRPKQSYDILKWYKTCFGMRPFQIVNSSPDIDETEVPTEEARQEKKQFQLASVDIKEEVGMKMTVGEWITSWMCREEGVKFPDVDDVLNFKLVLAEPLEEDSDSHVQQFLDSHHGPGLQHIGLTSSNVTKTVEWMNKNGAKFRAPPPTYYQLDHKKLEIASANEDLEKFKHLGLLIDSEADIGSNDPETQDRFLIQIFTRPLFFPKQNTFFLEILERRGARGFGAGNIIALARSIILQQQQEESLKRVETAS